MGGPMSVTDAPPWIEPVSSFLREAVEGDIPVIGHCLGGQLLAHALGARVFRAATPELGWSDVDACAGGAHDDGLRGPDRFTAFEWHCDAFDMPAGATRAVANAFHANPA